jgi:hypothetical protein
MSESRVSQLVIAKTNNGTSVWLYVNVGTVSQTVRFFSVHSRNEPYIKRNWPCVSSLGSGLPSHLPKGDVPCPFSPPHGFLHHTMGTHNIAIGFGQS